MMETFPLAYTELNGKKQILIAEVKKLRIQIAQMQKDNGI